MKSIAESLSLLEEYISSQAFKGYDPYDTLNSCFPIRAFGKKAALIAIEFQKRSPVNFRPLLGIKKKESTKGMGLLLSSYVGLYNLSHDQSLIPKINQIKEWILAHSTIHHGSICWGYDYPYQSNYELVTKGFPTVIHHSYITRGLFDYFNTFKDPEVKSIILESKSFIINSLNKIIHDDGICYSYNPRSQNCIYNASLHAAECLARVYHLNGDEPLRELIKNALRFVISRQRSDGLWAYGLTSTGGEVEQTDFHQGFILESIHEISNLLQYRDPAWDQSMVNGINYYKQQFSEDGVAKWRPDAIYPIDIHNQAQGIITFSKLGSLNENNLDFAHAIALNTIKNMQHPAKGHFYYRIYPSYTNKIPYIRWAQSWMMLALVTLLKNSPLPADIKFSREQSH